MSTRIGQVKTFFDQTELYLKTDYNIRIRAEIVKGFVGNKHFNSILDIGCGNGAISLPLLRQNNHLTLLDISSNMLSIARASIPPALASNVETINEDFMRAAIPSQAYDLVLCIGVLAHVDSPNDVIARMATLLKPGGSIIVQNSDIEHPFSHLLNLYTKLRGLPLWAPYTLNRLGSKKLVESFNNHGLKQAGVYRYNQPIPGTARLFTNDRAYTFIRKVYGTHKNNSCAWLGSECIYHFTTKSAR